jgi:hypothetical protein
MTILEFTDKFPDEASCRKDFKEKRESEGIICKTCKGLDHYWLASNESVKAVISERPCEVDP